MNPVSNCLRRWFVAVVFAIRQTGEMASRVPAAILLPACLLATFFDLGCSEREATVTPVDAGTVVGSRDGSTAFIDNASDGDGGRGHCRLGKSGPAMGRIGWFAGIAFCIDTTEVTNSDYAAFLAASPAASSSSSSSQSARCKDWNTSFQPPTPDFKPTNGPACPVFDPVARAELPVVCVDWCDADAYCRWAGKRLCGRPVDGNVVDGGQSNISEWSIACTLDGTKRYPYGNDPTVARCVDRRYPQAAPDVRPVKDAPLCEGGAAGVFDMSGNAWEWVDDCEDGSVAGVPAASAGSNDACLPRGGSFSSDVTLSSCADAAPFRRADVAGDTGFRCCADAEFFAP